MRAILALTATSGPGALASGFGHYYCLQNSLRPKVVYLVSALNGSWRVAARVTSGLDIREDELVIISRLVDDAISDADSRNTLETNDWVVNKGYKIEPIHFQNGLYGHFRNAKIRIRGPGYPKGGLSLPGSSAFVIETVEEMTPLFYIFPGGTTFRIEPNDLGPIEPVDGHAAGRFGAPYKLTQRYCGYWHDS